MYEPKSPRLVVVRSRISERSWNRRVERARENAKVLEEIARQVDEGETLNETIRKVVAPARRSWVIRHWLAFRRDGFEALIDQRMPREPRIATECAGLIEAARMANPQVTVEEVTEILHKQKVRSLPSASTSKKHFARVDARRRYEEGKEKKATKVVELPLAGGELLLAAEVETGGVAALVDEVKAMGEEAVVASQGQEPNRDVEHRDEGGHFTAAYNERRKRKRGQAVASYLRSAAEKAEGRVPSWARFVHATRETLEAKVWTVVLSPLVSQTKGWEALRAPEAAGLASLSGYAYMPSTLAKFSSELAVANAGPRLLEKVGMHWHGVAQARWGRKRGDGRTLCRQPRQGGMELAVHQERQGVPSQPGDAVHHHHLYSHRCRHSTCGLGAERRRSAGTAPCGPGAEGRGDSGRRGTARCRH
jgi:hypothetical protein